LAVGRGPNNRCPLILVTRLQSLIAAIS
jgi:hypothetical protein